MSSCRINLLKLIDLAIGCPNPGSVNFHLLHKIIYILALRDGTVLDVNEIELSNSSGIVDQRLLNDALRDGNQTRLTVQRVSNGSDFGDVRLRIAGSRIMFPCDATSQKSLGSEPSHMESKMSAMSSMVSDLEERVQEISLKPDSVTGEAVNELRRRIDALECMVERQVAKLSIQDTAGSEPPQKSSNNYDELAEQLWDSIRLLESKLNALSETTAGDTNETQLLDETISSNVPEIDPAEPGRLDIFKIVQNIESRQIELETKLQSLTEEICEAKVKAAADIADEDFPALSKMFEQLALLENKTSSKIEQIEHLITRLFQEKADDVAIESRIRQSIRLTSDLPARSSISSYQGISNQQRIDDAMTLTLTKQLESQQTELDTLRQNVNTKANQDDVHSLINVIDSKILQIHNKIQTIEERNTSKMGNAAGSKCNPIINVRCISCDRTVTQDACIEIVPKPSQIRSSRILKPTLKRQLHEARRSLERQEAVGGALRNMNHFEKIYTSLLVRKLHKGN